MNHRILLAGALGALAMFVWMFLAHMVMPLGEAGVKQIDHEEALLATMKSTLNQGGIYLFPNMPPTNDQATNEKMLANGPSGMLIYIPSREFSFGRALGVEYATEFLQALIVAYLLSLTRAGTFAARLGFFAMAGLLVAIATNVSYWNWYAFPAAYTDDKCGSAPAS
jgi:hypothetical protein